MKKEKMENKEVLPVMERFDDDPMYSNSCTISHNPDKFVIDFKQIVRQFPMNENILLSKHRVVILDVAMAKEVKRVLDDNIAMYEKKFGKIPLPKTQEVNEIPNVIDMSGGSYIG